MKSLSRHLPKFAALAAVVALAAPLTAWALAINLVELTQFFKGGINVSTGANYSSSHKVANILHGSITHDFGVGDAGVNTCIESSAITVTGAAITDPCMLGYNATTLETVNQGNQVNLRCRSGTDSAYVVVCMNGQSVNLPSAAYEVWVVGD